MTDEAPTPGPRSEHQAFLIGPNLYLRPVELADAKTAAIWRPQPFPAPTEVVEKQLKEQLEIEPDDEEGNQLLIICRRDNDQPVGSVRVRTGGRHFGHLFPKIDRLASESQRDEIVAELTGILVPWLINERNFMTVFLIALPGSPAIQQKVTELSGRVAVQLRDRFLIDGRRRDLVQYQMFSQEWLETLGAPPEPVIGEQDRRVASPAAPRIVVPPDERPQDAFAIGERVYLRPFKPEEGELVARWALEESEIYYNEGRAVFNPVSYGHLHKMIAEKEIPGWVRFAIVLRETGLMIGCIGIDNIDWVHNVAETETEIFQPKFRSAGLGTEAKHLLLDYAFERLGLHAIYSYVGEANTRSSAALLKQGYRQAGYAAWITLKPGGMLGYGAFDLLASKWQAARDSRSGMSRS